MKAASNPWMKFYPSDWRADPALRSCTIAARGLWIEMLCIMHEATPYGSLLIKGKRIDKKLLASLAGIPEKECVVLMLELEGFGVFDRDEDGTIYSRRMRRDHAKAEEGRKQIAKRWGDEKPDSKPNSEPIRSDEPKNEAVVDSQKPETTVDRIGSAGASAFTEGSKALASVFWKSLGFESQLDIPPEFAGVDWRALEWERAGWTVDLVESIARKTGSKKPLNYHEKCFATEFAKRQAPLPIVEIKSAETLTVTHGTAKNQSVSAVAKRLAEQFESQSGGDIAGNSDAFLRLSQG